MARAVPNRLAEFTAGRAAARCAMAALGLPHTAIPAGQDRAPVWPDGVVGSIAHADGICAAIVARLGSVWAVGVDLEPGVALDPDLWPQVCTMPEQAFLASQPKEFRGHFAKLIFSAKESAYKCIYPHIQTVLGFDAMQISIDLSRHQFTATLCQPVGRWAKGDQLTGGYGRANGLIVTAMVLR